MSLMQLVNGTWVTVTRHICPPGEGLTHSLECTSSQHTTGQGEGCKKGDEKNEELYLQDDYMFQLQVFKRYDRL